MKQWEQGGGMLGGARQAHTSRPWRDPEPLCDALDSQVPGRPPQILGKNSESLVCLNPMGASADSGWEPGVKTRHPQDQDVKP